MVELVTSDHLALWPPTPVTLDTYSVVMLVGLVKLLERGVVVNQPVNVSSFRQHVEMVIHILFPCSDLF